MDRLMVGVIVGVSAALVIPVATGVGLAVRGERKCASQVKELERIRGTVEVDLAVLHSTPLEMVPVCDSGDSPYLDARLDPLTSPDQAARHLQTEGWRFAKTYRGPDGTIWSWELQKDYRAGSAYLSIDQVDGKPVSINIQLV